MASDDDDFALLGDDAQSHHHHHQHPPPPLPATAASFSRYASKPPKKDDDQEGYGEAFAPPDASINPHHHCFPNDASAPNPFARSHADDAAAADRPAHHHDPTKRKDRDELSDGESPYCFNTSSAKKSRPIPSSSGGERDYRKDREEWSDFAIGCLLDAYTEKYSQLNRGNLRGRDWEDVATSVSERCDKQKAAKSVEQCKNKIDNLKKRYKVECHRLNSGSPPVSHWPWFKKMEQIIGSPSSVKVAPDDNKSAVVMRQIKSCPFLASAFNIVSSRPVSSGSGRRKPNPNPNPNAPVHGLRRRRLRPPRRRCAVPSPPPLTSAAAASFSRYASKPPKKDADQEGYGQAFAPPDASINPHHHCFPNDASAPNPFARSHADDAAAAADRPAHHHDPTKRTDRDELSDGESPYCFNTSSAKKSRPIPSSSGGERDYRKDRKEWSDFAIGCLLDAYTEKYSQLNRGNLRGRDWEDVATSVSERCDKQKAAKSVEQCKNKIDNLKKRYKVECHRLNSGSPPVSHWPWFKKMEQIIGSSSSVKVAPDDNKSAVVMRQIKRYPASSPGSISLTNNFKMNSLSNPRWKRVVLKISGSVLIGSGQQNVDPKVITLIAREIAMANRVGVEVAVVVGGRNFFCSESWVAATSIDRDTAYQIGMMASAMNSMLLLGSLEKTGVEARVQTGFVMQEMSEPYIRRRAIRHLEKGRVVIFGGISAGTGNPLLTTFTTDTAAALRASEIHADAVLKCTNVDSVYDCHSRNNAGAFEHISFRDLVSRGVTAMDTTAITICGKNNIPVVIFNLLESGNLSRALCGDQVGTLIDQMGRIS